MQAEKAYTIDVILWERSEKLGVARLDVMYLDDGTTAFWGNDPGGAPIARRMVPYEAWEVDLAAMLPGPGDRMMPTGAAVHLTVTQQGWRFSQPEPPEFVCYRSLGPRTLLLHVVEAEGLPSRTTRVHASVSYGPLRFDTHACENTLHPVWNTWFKVEESPDPALR